MSAAADDTSSDDMVAQFLAFTGSADPSRAQSYLEMSGGDLQTAVSLYLEHQGGGGGGMGGGGGGMGGGLGGGAGAAGAGAPSDFGDAGGDGEFGGGGGGGGGGMMGDDVRAPDRTRTMRLMDFDDGGGHPGAGAAAALARSGMLGRNAAAMMGAAMGGMGAGDDETGAVMSAFATDLGVAASAAASSSASAGGASGVGMPSSMMGPAGAPDVREAVNRAAAVAAAGASGDSKEDDLDDDEEESARRPSPPASRNLSEMFAQPTHLMHTAGGFQGARNVARDARRWLLVNLQRDSDFACHALNRDVWRDELVENLVREGFIFWQSTDVSADGSTYAQRYSVHEYPHVAIIDPRTGRLMWKKEGWTQVDPMTAEQFAEIAADFCSRHSFDRPPVAPRATSSTSASASAASAVGGASSNGGLGRDSAAAAKKRPMREMTEEEQLQAAIQASMQSGGDSDEDDDMDQGSDDDLAMEDDSDEEAEYSYQDGEDEVEVVAPPAAVAADAVPLGAVTRSEPQQPATRKQEEAKEEAEEEKEEDVAPSFEQGLLAMEVGDEPTGGDVARVQIRMPDGKRLVRKFRGDDTVRTIYAFVAQSGGEESRPFELKAGFPPRDIRPKVDETIKGCGLAGEAITVRWTS